MNYLQKSMLLGGLAFSLLGLPSFAHAESSQDLIVKDLENIQNWQPIQQKGLPEGSETAILSGDPTKGESSFLLKVPGRSHVANHNHSAAETYLWLKGNFTLTLSDGTKTSYKNQTFLFFPPNAPPHALDCDSDNACIIYLHYSHKFDMKTFPDVVTKK